MNAKAFIAGLVVAGSLLAQSPTGPRGRGPMGGRGRGGPGAAAAVVGAPYSAVEVRTSQQALAAGNAIQRQEQANIYRDSQGRIRREATITGPNGQTLTRVTIADPVAGVFHQLDAKTKTAVTRPVQFPNSQTIGSGRLQMMGAGGRTPETEANVKRETLATQSMHGLMASGTRVTRTIPAGTIGNTQAIETVQETWVSDELKVPLMTKVSDPRVGTTTTELTNINRGEPDPALFQIPSDYTVQKGMGGWHGTIGRGPGARQQ